jgi:hypothetical protein
MKVMFFVWGRDMQVIIAKWFSVLSQLSQNFIIAPIFMSARIVECKEILYQFEQDRRKENYEKIEILPVYLKSPDSRLGKSRVRAGLSLN